MWSFVLRPAIHCILALDNIHQLLVSDSNIKNIVIFVKLKKI